MRISPVRRGVFLSSDMNGSRRRTSASTCVVLLAAAAAAHAQTRPDAGTVRQQIEQQQRTPLPPAGESLFAPPPPLKSIGGTTITVHRFTFSGNTLLSNDELLPVVVPVTDDSSVAGIGIFAATPEQTREILDDDPGVRAGIFRYEIHPVRGFPGAALP